jgi:hypothetical protein
MKDGLGGKSRDKHPTTWVFKGFHFELEQEMMIARKNCVDGNS